MDTHITFDQLPTAVQQMSAKLDRLELLITNLPTSNTEKEEDQLLTVSQTATFLNLTIPTIYGKVSKRETPFMKRSKRLYFSKTELMDYLRKGKSSSMDELERVSEGYIKASS